MATNIITNISGIKELKTIIEQNKGLIIISFRAKWCNPCKRVVPLIDSYLYNQSYIKDIQTYIIDIDECIQLYMELKRLRILSGVPSLLCYQKNILDFFPADAVFGSDEAQINDFFHRCNKRFYDIKTEL
jgi:thiol:disulfide interchange protein